MCDADFIDSWSKGRMDIDFNNPYYKKNKESNSSYTVIHDSNNSERYNELDKRISRIEKRVDKLFDLLESSNRVGNNGYKYGSPFVICKDGNVRSDTSIELTDKQFRMLLEEILK